MLHQTVSDVNSLLPYDVCVCVKHLKTLKANSFPLLGHFHDGAEFYGIVSLLVINQFLVKS